MMKRNAFVLLTILSFGVVVVFIPASARSQPGSLATAAATVRVAIEMADAPTTCGPSPEPVDISKHYASVIGAWPIWGTLAYGSGGMKGMISMRKERPQPARLPGWWAQKVLWLVKTSYKGEVRLRGFNVTDQSPMYFTLNNNAPTAVAVLNPANPGAWSAGSDQFANFPSLVWVSKAGCYKIEAEWNNGSWDQVLSVGYLDEAAR
jgi:hypothetical protein